MKRKPQYRVVGSVKEWGIVADRGGIIYDLLDKEEALRICSILNRGIGPEWDKVEPELEKLEAEVSYGSGT